MLCCCLYSSFSCPPTPELRETIRTHVPSAHMQGKAEDTEYVDLDFKMPLALSSEFPRLLPSHGPTEESVYLFLFIVSILNTR